MPNAWITRWALVVLLGGGLRAAAQEDVSSIGATEEEPISIVSRWERNTDSGEYRARAGFRYYGPNGLGYTRALMSAEAFVPLLQLDQSLLFSDLRTYLHDGQLGFNLGGGHRLYSGFFDKTFGIYGFFDNMNTGNRTISQVTGGFDILGSSWEARANLYYPLDRNAQVVRTPLTDSVFVGNQLLSNRLLVHETGLTTIDFETGHLLYERLNLWGFIGGYHMQGETNPHTWGGKARLEMRVSDKLTVQVSIQHDELFDTNAILSAALFLPGTRPSRATNQDLAPDRLAFPVERQQNIIVAESTTVDRVIPLNPATGEPFHVVHVASGTASSGPDAGTFESPFATIREALEAAGPNSVVYVQPNQDGYVESLNLLPGQIVLGSGSTHYLGTTSGATIVPSLTSERVVLVNSPGNAVTLADRSILAGFDIRNPQGSAIFGNGVLNPTVVDNIIEGGVHGIQLINATGFANIRGNTINGSAREGLLIRNSAGSLQLDFSDNTVTNTVAVGVGDGAVSMTTSGSASIAAAMARNTIRGSTANGVHLDATNNSRLDVEIANSYLESHVQQGVSARVADAAVSNIGLTSNTIANNQYGVSLRAEGGPNSSLTIGATQNNIKNNQLGGVKMAASNQSKLSGQLGSNLIEANNGDGVRLVSSDKSQLNLSLEGNTLINNHVGVSFISDGGADNHATLTLKQNSISGSSSHGVDVTTGNQSHLTLVLEGNQIAESAGDGVRLSALNSSRIDAALGSNVLSKNKTGVLAVFDTDAAQGSTLNVTQNEIASSKLDGLRIETKGDSYLAGAVQSNLFKENVGSGVSLVNSGSSRLYTEIRSNTFSDNQAPGIQLVSQGSDVSNELRAWVKSNTIAGTATPGFEAETLQSGRMFLELTGNDSARGFSISNHGDSPSRLHLAFESNDGGVLTDGSILPATVGSFTP